jgi:hypothetical protein
VRFDTAPSRQPVEPASTLQPTADYGAVFSASWKKKMEQAVVEADVVAMQSLIHEVQDSAPEISQKLSQLVYNFDYDGIRSFMGAL